MSNPNGPIFEEKKADLPPIGNFFHNATELLQAPIIEDPEDADGTLEGPPPIAYSRLHATHSQEDRCFRSRLSRQILNLLSQDQRDKIYTDTLSEFDQLVADQKISAGSTACILFVDPNAAKQSVTTTVYSLGDSQAVAIQPDEKKQVKTTCLNNDLHHPGPDAKDARFRVERREDDTPYNTYYEGRIRIREFDTYEKDAEGNYQQSNTVFFMQQNENPGVYRLKGTGLMMYKSVGDIESRANGKDATATISQPQEFKVTAEQPLRLAVYSDGVPEAWENPLKPQELEASITPQQLAHETNLASHIIHNTKMFDSGPADNRTCITATFTPENLNGDPLIIAIADGHANAPGDGWKVAELLQKSYAFLIQLKMWQQALENQLKQNNNIEQYCTNLSALIAYLHTQIAALRSSPLYNHLKILLEKHLFELLQQQAKLLSEQKQITKHTVDTFFTGFNALTSQNRASLEQQAKVLFPLYKQYIEQHSLEHQDDPRYFKDIYRFTFEHDAKQLVTLNKQFPDAKLSATQIFVKIDALLDVLRDGSNDQNLLTRAANQLPSIIQTYIQALGKYQPQEYITRVVTLFNYLEDVIKKTTPRDQQFNVRKLLSHEFAPLLLSLAQRLLTQNLSTHGNDVLTLFTALNTFNAHSLKDKILESFVRQLFTKYTAESLRNPEIDAKLVKEIYIFHVNSGNPQSLKALEDLGVKNPTFRQYSTDRITILEQRLKTMDADTKLQPWGIQLRTSLDLALTHASEHYVNNNEELSQLFFRYYQNNRKHELQLAKFTQTILEKLRTNIRNVDLSSQKQRAIMDNSYQLTTQIIWHLRENYDNSSEFEALQLDLLDKEIAYLETIVAPELDHGLINFGTRVRTAYNRLLNLAQSDLSIAIDTERLQGLLKRCATIIQNSGKTSSIYFPIAPINDLSDLRAEIAGAQNKSNLTRNLSILAIMFLTAIAVLVTIVAFMVANIVTHGALTIAAKAVLGLVVGIVDAASLWIASKLASDVKANWLSNNEAALQKAFRATAVSNEPSMQLGIADANMPSAVITKSGDGDDDKAREAKLAEMHRRLESGIDSEAPLPDDQQVPHEPHPWDAYPIGIRAGNRR